MGEQTARFDGRKSLGDTAEAIVENYLRTHGYQVSRTGAESNLSEDARSELVRIMSRYPAVEHVIRMPDFSVIGQQTGQRAWVDAKSTDAISQASYRHYMTLDQRESVYLFIVRAANIYAVRVRDIVFLPPGWRPANRPDADDWGKIDFQRSKGREIRIGR
jgi:hypothetical protein